MNSNENNCNGHSEPHKHQCFICTIPSSDSVSWLALCQQCKDNAGKRDCKVRKEIKNKLANVDVSLGDGADINEQFEVLQHSYNLQNLLDNDKGLEQQQQQNQKQETSDFTSNGSYYGKEHFKLDDLPKEDKYLIESIFEATRKYTEAKYTCTMDYFIANGGVPKEHDELWKTVSLSIGDIVKCHVPFLKHFLSSQNMLESISPFDLCQLVDSFYFLLFSVRSAVLAKNDVASAFGLLFQHCLVKWPEMIGIMQQVRSMIEILRQWKPTAQEFAILIALIFCRSIEQSESISENFKVDLEKLAKRIEEIGSNLFSAQGNKWRWRQLQLISAMAVDVQRIRQHAVRPLKLRSPDLLNHLLMPVCQVVCSDLIVEAEITEQSLIDHFVSVI